MKLEAFNYDLPKELIAQEPAEPRDACRLLRLDKHTGQWAHHKFRDILEEIMPGDVFVFNNTKVIPARLQGIRKETGGKVEVLLLSPKGQDCWEILVKPGRKALPGEEIIFSEHCSCRITDKTEFGGRIAEFHYEGDFDELLDTLGEMPTPPYIHKKLGSQDEYQTVYAKYKGSAAAPTAGLHFTPELMKDMEAKGAVLLFVTLHVGIGTFRPVTEENVEDHEMHREWYTVSEDTACAINRAKAEGRRVIAVGTTSVRTLESASQNGKIEAGSHWTQLYIYPGYSWKTVDAILTNFHLPQSTLIMMMASFVGRDRILAAYAEAVKEKYRFFSFGDAMLII